MTRVIDPRAARAALRALPHETNDGESPNPEHVHLPRSHLKALHPDSLLVSGMRGAGKTFWWSAAQNPAVRRLLSTQDARLSWTGAAEIRTGFGVPATDDYPGKDVLHNLLEQGFEPRIVWRTVQARQLAPAGHPLRCDGWSARVSLVRREPEAIDRLFQDSDTAFDGKGIYCLFLFDALDRCADDWRDMYRIIRGLLQTALEMRAYRRLRVKVFLRSDQLDETAIGDFPDASKVLASEVELDWPRHELYGLLWHLLANGKERGVFRRLLTWEDWPSVDVGGRPVAPVPREVVLHEEDQRRNFHELAGAWMGTDPRRGFPWTWIPNHLGDTEGRVSPRSFLAALRTAAEDTAERHPDHEHALHYESIKRGVQSASKIRVRELQEDYPWVQRLAGPLEGMLVPCRFEEIASRWRQGGVVEGLAKAADQDRVKLSPRGIDRGADGIRESLESLGIFYRMRDGRVNIPDVYRVGYRLGRKGGVKPVR